VLLLQRTCGRSVDWVLLQAALAMFLCGIDVSAGGLLISKRDHVYVARAMAVTLTLSLCFFAASIKLGWGLAGVWWGLVLFFGMRFAQSVPRLISLL
jgi:Na+-driven multidrug efflux pump